MRRRDDARDITAVVLACGRVVAVWDDELALMTHHGTTRVRRASHVEPFESPVFGLVWRVDMSPVGGTDLGSFVTRQAALDAERLYLASPEGIALMVGHSQERAA